MRAPRTNLLDRCLTEVDRALRVSAVPARAATDSPAASTPDNSLSSPQQALAANLMRVNHAGEVAAQALYRGQALVARDPALEEALHAAADEEHDHLAWCAQRLSELNSSPSVLTPVWYAGSALIGMAAGLAGDKISLGFIGETERQVTKHLEGHLERLPEQDMRSRKILERMRDDEIQHGATAMDKGGAVLPSPVRSAMRIAAKVMTTVSFRV
jgi:ubiquinone biosynthesis monooxygenase Coq7